AKKAGKSTIVNNLIGRPFSKAYNPTELEQYAVNVVDGYEGDKKYLVLKEIPRDEVTKLLANKDSLASCDVAIVVHDRLHI
ncbi:mitochondrial rho GTPase 1-like protein, partial [Trifolium pratense]